MSEAKVLKGSVKYDNWIDQSYLFKTYKLVDGA
jgi:sulfonate transport system substrate-binding protein